MQKYPNDIVITADDDIIYPRDFIKQLLKTHYKYPNCIVARRTHEIRFDSSGRMLSYTDWGYETRHIKEPSFCLLGTGGAGVLYPPASLYGIFADFATISTTSLYADDLWLKYMSLLGGIKTVLASQKNFSLRYVPGSQDHALFIRNVLGRGNDMAIASLEQRFWENVDIATRGDFYPPRSDILISIVVPVFNAENTLTRCLESIRVQYGDDCELIMVDDGSTDNSAEIAKKYSFLLPRARYVFQNNGGSNSAYNLGFALAKGRYILSLDDDDEIGPDTINALRNELRRSKPDIVQFQVEIYRSRPIPSERHCTRPIHLNDKQITSDNIKAYIGGEVRTHSGKIIRTDLAKGIAFSGNPHGADTRFFIKVLSRATSISVVPNALWKHHIQKNSQSNRPHDMNFHYSWLEHLEADLSFFKKQARIKPIIGIEILFSHYCFYCQESYARGSFDAKKSRSIGLIFWRYRSLFGKEERKEIIKRIAFPRWVACRNNVRANRAP